MTPVLPADSQWSWDTDRASMDRACRRALEINTRHLLDPVILEWWRHEGGESVAFGSDAHRPEDLAQRFDVAAAMAAAHGFRPGSQPHDPWTAVVA